MGLTFYVYYSEEKYVRDLETDGWTGSHYQSICNTVVFCFLHCDDRYRPHRVRVIRVFQLILVGKEDE
jgi:hypothetical protein